MQISWPYPGSPLVGPAASGRATAGPTRAVPAVAAQTTPAQTVSWSIPITNIDPDNLVSSNAAIRHMSLLILIDPHSDKLFRWIQTPTINFR